MKAFLFAALSGVGLAIGSGCASTATDSASALFTQSETCPVCKTKLVRAGDDGRGRPKYKSVHVCPECRMEVQTATGDGRSVHKAVTGATMTDCKTCNPK